MATLSLTPDVKTVMGGSSNILYNATVKGDFSRFRKLLIAIGALPYIDHIEEIDIKQTGDSTEYRLKLWMAVAG